MEAKAIALLVGLLALAGTLGGLYWWGNSWHSKYTALVNQNLAQKLADQTAVVKALQKQIADRDSTLSNNKQVINDLSAKHAADVANLGSTTELVNRLLHDAVTVPTPSPLVSETGSGRAADGPANDGGNGRVGDLLVRVAGEYRKHVEQCTALQAEIAPQL